MGTTGQSITLANSIIGVGILAMPFCFQQCGILLASLILLSMGLISRLCCYFLLKSALIARRRNFEFLAFHVFGTAGKLAVEVGIIGFLMGTCIAYFVVVGDLGPQIIAKMFNINQSDILRTSIMVIVSLVCVLPLGLLRNVDSLSNVSAATIGFYFCLVMKVIAEAASQLLTGDWHTKMELWKPAGVLQCVPIFSMALFCQTQLFEIFESLPSLSLEKMNVVTKNAINICTGVYFTLGVFGYIAFCSQNISGNILMSLSPTMASDVIKLGFVMSLAFSFPLIIFPCRASLYSFLYKKVHSSHHDHIINHSIPEGTFRIITVCIVGVALFISLLLPNIELVLGLLGSTIGVLICVVFPAACFINVTFKNTNERVLAKGIVILGLVIMVLGTYANLQAAERENKVDRYDEKYITQERIDKMVEDFFQSKRLEKSDDVIIKPLSNNDPLPQEDTNKINQEIKDSEVQPPNPIPPESQSNEKNNHPDGKGVKNDNIDKKLKEILPEVQKEDKVPHPRNVKGKINEAKLSNGANNVDNIVEKPKNDEVKPASNEEKINIKKQQQLIETIKQHGKEQKELIKEQKEILDELIKTKKELQQDKKEVDPNEAKKIAVESIQKIANMAIQSLSGVSEKPLDEAKNFEKKSEPLEKIANEAVQEIAKKAVETIEAIKEINEKPKDQPLPKNENKVETNKNLQSINHIEKVSNMQPNIQNSNLQAIDQSVNNVNPENALPKQKVHNVPANINVNNVPNNTNNVPIINQQVNPNNVPVINQQINPNNVPVINQQDNPENVPVINQGINSNNVPAVNQQINSDNVPVKINQQNNNQQIVNKLVANQDTPYNNVGNQAVLNQNEQPIQKQNIEKVHSHSPDEPQSYKQGEDSQKNNNPETNPVNNIAQNVPLPLAMKGNSVNNQVNDAQNLNSNKANNVESKGIKEIINGNYKLQQSVENLAARDLPINNLQQNINPDNSAVIRQKREVVDCTKTTTLKQEDRQICETLIGKMPKESQEILSSKVDLSEVGLSRHLPIDMSVGHLRSLKSHDETKEER